MKTKTNKLQHNFKLLEKELCIFLDNLEDGGSLVTDQEKQICKLTVFSEQDRKFAKNYFRTLKIKHRIILYKPEQEKTND